MTRRLHALAAVTLAAAATGTVATTPATASTITVENAEELQHALETAQPGDRIELGADGDFSGAFVATADGTAEAPITLIGSSYDQLTNSGGTALRFDDASHWYVYNLEVTDAATGIAFEDSDNITAEAVRVWDVAGDGVYMDGSSSSNTLNVSVNASRRGATIDGDHNTLLMGGFKHIRQQMVVIGEEATGTDVGGYSSAVGATSAEAWMVVYGDGNHIGSNITVYEGGGNLVDGYRIHGCGNDVSGTDSDLNGAPGYAIHVTRQPACEEVGEPNVVYRSNIQQHAGSGLTNIEITRE